MLKGERPENWRNSLYYHYYEYPAEHSVKRHYGVRDDRYKLIHFYNDIDVWELYDLQEDPHEMNNLYGKPSYEAVTKRMRDELYKLQNNMMTLWEYASMCRTDESGHSCSVIRFLISCGLRCIKDLELGG